MNKKNCTKKLEIHNKFPVVESTQHENPNGRHVFELEWRLSYLRISNVEIKSLSVTLRLLTSFAVSLKVVVIMSIPFLSVLESSVSPTVFTVIVEFPSTRPKDETADFSWFAKFDVKRNRNRGLDFFIVLLTWNRTKIPIRIIWKLNCDGIMLNWIRHNSNELSWLEYI